MRGGFRKGGGRPKGSTSRPALRDYYSQEELEEFIAQLKRQAKVNPKIAVFVAEQIFGKAPQPISGDGEDMTPITFVIKGINGTTSN